MHLNGIAKRITALALGAALLTATALPAFAEGTQPINVKLHLQCHRRHHLGKDLPRRLWYRDQ